MKLQKRIITFAAVIISLSYSISFAAHPLVTDDAGTLGKGAIQIEINGEVSKDKNIADGSTTRTYGSQVATTIGIGIADKLDLGFGITRPWDHGDVDSVQFNNAGSTDFSLNAKWQACEHDGFSVAIKPQLGYSYNVGGSSDDYTVSTGTSLIVSKEIEKAAFHLNTGYTRNYYRLASVRDTNRNLLWNISLATTYEVIKELKLVTDFGAATNQDKATGKIPVFGLVGAIYSAGKNIDLSTGIKVGLTKPETDITGIFGVTLKF